MQNPFNGCASPTGLVDHFIGDAYPVVRDVQRHLAQITYVAQNLDSLVPKPLEFRFDEVSKYLQYRYVGALTWINLAYLPELDVAGITQLVADAQTKADEAFAKATLNTEAITEIQTKAFPMIVLDRATTSWANIKSLDISQDRSADLANLLDMKKEVIIDTQIAVNTTVVSNKAFARISGGPSGIILAGPNMKNLPMLEARGHNTQIRDLRWDNPLLLKDPTGGRQSAINIHADNVLVYNNYFDHQLHAVICAADGEWYMPEFNRCQSWNGLGVGKGPNDDGVSPDGEDRGDAFVIWGSTGRMLNCWAHLMDGQDARIAFHAEGLDGTYNQRPHNLERDGHDILIENCYAIGAFRRHFAFESVYNSTMRNVFSLGGATWWNLCLITAFNCLVDGFHLKYTRKVNDNSGAAWGPSRAAIGFGHNGRNSTIRNGKIVFAAGAVGNFFESRITALAVENTQFENIDCTKVDSTPTGNGADVSVAINPIFRNVQIEKVIYGFYSYGGVPAGQNFNFENVRIDQASAAGYHFETSTNLYINGGNVVNSGAAVQANFATGVSIKGMTTHNIAGLDIDIYAQTAGAKVIIEGNENTAGTGKVNISGAGAGIIPADVKWNISDNPGYQTTFRYALAGITGVGSMLNTFGKQTGRTVVADDNFEYTATGGLPTDPWIKKTATQIVPT